MKKNDGPQLLTALKKGKIREIAQGENNEQQSEESRWRGFFRERQKLNFKELRL